MFFAVMASADAKLPLNRKQKLQV